MRLHALDRLLSVSCASSKSDPIFLQVRLYPQNAIYSPTPEIFFFPTLKKNDRLPSIATGRDRTLPKEQHKKGTGQEKDSQRKTKAQPTSSPQPLYFHLISRRPQLRSPASYSSFLPTQSGSRQTARTHGQRCCCGENNRHTQCRAH